MAKARKKRKKKRGGRSRGGGGGGISGLRGGIKSFVGQGPRRKESTFSRVLTYLLLAAVVGVLAYRLSHCV